MVPDENQKQMQGGIGVFAQKPYIPKDRSLFICVTLAVLVALGGTVQAAESFDDVILGLQSNDWTVRLASAKSLGSMEGSAAEAVPALVTLLEGLQSQSEGIGRDVVLEAAVEAAGKIGPEAEAAVPALLLALSEADPGVREAAAIALGRIGVGGDAVATALAKALKDDEVSVRLAAAGSLGRIGPAVQTKDAVVTLIDALDDPAFVVRTAVKSALGTVWLRGRSLDSGLAEALHDGDSSMRRAAAKALARSGSKAAADLGGALSDADPDVRQAALDSLGRIGVGAKAAVPMLVELLESDDSEVRLSVVEVLGKIRAGEAVQALSGRLNDEDDAVRLAVVDTLGRIGGSEVVGLLTKLLADRDSEVRVAAAKALAQIGQGAGDAVYALGGMLQEMDGKVRTAVRALLVRSVLPPYPQ